MEPEVANKIKSVSEAVKLIPNGAQVALGGWVINRCVTALAHEMIRQRKRDLTITQQIGAMDGDLLVGAGCAKRYIYGGGSLEPVFGPLSRIHEAIINREIEVEEYSGTSMCFKYLAGALGIPYIPMKALLGSDILTLLSAGSADIKVDECPFTKEKLVLLRALNPDIALVHAQRVDTEGNVCIYGALWVTKEMSRAAKNVIVSSEEIVDPSLTRQNPEHTIIPSHKVAAIVHIPFGAHPTTVYKHYDYDSAHLTEYTNAARHKETFESYLQEYVFGVQDHSEYLEKIGLKRLLQLKAKPHLGY